MKNLKFMAFAVLLSFFYSNVPAEKISKKNGPIKTLLIDTSGSKVYKYKSFIEIAKSVGFEFEYKPLEEVLDNGQDFDLSNYKAAFFIFGVSFLKTIGRSSASNKILNLIERFYKKEGVTIGFILPSLGAGQGNKVQVLLPIFVKMGLIKVIKVIKNAMVQQQNFGKIPAKQKKVQLKPDAEFNSFLTAANMFLSLPLEARPLTYDTALKPPAKVVMNFDVKFEKFKFPVISLPQKKDLSKDVGPTLPHGIYWFDKKHRNNVFLTYTTLASFSGIAENFQFCPSDFNVRAKIHNSIQQTLWELQNIINMETKSGDTIDGIKKLKTPKLPSYISRFGYTKFYRTKKDYLKKIGWMDLVNFEDPVRTAKMTDSDYEKEKSKRKRQQPKLIDSIFKSGIDWLWVVVNPQMYYSPIGVRKGFEQRFLDSIKLFTKMLKEKAEQLEGEVPKFLIGYEIVDNIHQPNLPKNFSVDLYGNEYKDLPSCLDLEFWETEIAAPLETFMKKWEDLNLGNGISPSGVVLDFEMYMRMQSGAFLNTMGFEESLISEFKEKEKLDDKSEPLYGMQFLLKNKRMTKYYKFLRNAAFQLGQDMRQFFDEIIPGCFVSCYAPNISPDWFYFNFYKGLCDGDKQFQLLTFNTEFAIYEKWLNKNGLNIVHSSVLMLSKLKDESSFGLIDRILKRNYGVWINKWSRIYEDYNNIGGEKIERTPMSDKQKENFFSYLSDI